MIKCNDNLMVQFDEKNVLSLLKMLIDKTGGSYGVIDFNLLDSSLNSPFQSFAENDLYKTIEEKGARLGFNLVSNHAFVDGNKRIGLLVMLTFFEINNVKLFYTDDELVNLGLGLACGKITFENLLNWVLLHKTN